MPTWDEITPDIERWTRSSRLTATNILIGANVAALVAFNLLTSLFAFRLNFLPFSASAAIGSFQVWQFFTYTFVHPASIWYLFWFLMGAYSLYQIGNDLEWEIGRTRYLILYFASAAYGALLHAAYQYVGHSFVPAMTFFGPVFAVVTYYAWRYPSRPILFFFVIPMRMKTAVLLMGAIAFFFCLIQLHSGMSPFAFLGAGIFAVVMHYAEPLLDRWSDSLESRRDRSRMIEGIELRHKVDAILDKISREGIGSLTRTERRVLNRASESMGRDRHD